MSARQVKFFGDRRWWTVRAEDERFTILTRQAEFKPKGEVVYTIIDRERDVRGPCDLIGQGWDFSPETLDEDGQRLLAALNAHLAREAWFQERLAAGDHGPWPVPDEDLVQVSYRNNVKIRIEAER